MKAFEIYLKNLLDKLAKTDSQFAKDYIRKDKSIEECASVIVKALRDGCNRKSSFVNPSDEQIKGWAIHYYHESKVDSKSIDISDVEYSEIKEDKPKSSAPSKTKSSTIPKPTPKPADDFEDFDLDGDSSDEEVETSTNESDESNNSDFEDFEL